MGNSASKEFYEPLGFKIFAGDPWQNHPILKNENSLTCLIFSLELEARG
jgi:hypothetical protein